MNRFVTRSLVFAGVALVAAACRPEEAPRASRPDPLPAMRPASSAAESVTETVDSGTPASPVALPKKCAAESPVDAPCTSIGGTYRIRITPRASAKEHCFVTRSVEGKLTIDGNATYKGLGQASELDELGRSLGLEKPDLRIGAAVRDGVCCIDLILSDGKDVARNAKIHLARGASKVNAKGKERRVAGRDFCDEDLVVDAELER
jgi:hypothetical protein